MSQSCRSMFSEYKRKKPNGCYIPEREVHSLANRANRSYHFKIKDFLNFVLLPYNEGGSAPLKKYHSLPPILSGDFNFNFSLLKAEPVIAFMNDELKLEMNTNYNVSTANSGTVIDAVFQRFLNTLKS
ncbi:hypothetical protein TNCV_2471151 [Trichonephila clavipes]|nr:hypothetical protein TNCV_2471151 [Trichonephila clavipes]